MIRQGGGRSGENGVALRSALRDRVQFGCNSARLGRDESGLRCRKPLSGAHLLVRSEGLEPPTF